MLTESEYAEVRAARDFLWRVRNALHFLSGQHQDQLTFEFQERIAADLGYRDTPSLRAVEQFMRTYYLQARDGEPLLRRRSSRAASRTPVPYRLLGALAARQLRPGVRITSSELVVGDPADVARAAVAAAARVRRLAAPRRAAQRRQPADGARPRAPDRRPRAQRSRRGARLPRRPALDAPASPRRCRRCTTSTCSTPSCPEFAHLRCLAQYDRYHIYTVDEHTLRAVARLEELLHGEFKARAPLLTQVMREIDGIEVLYLAMLYHDIGKGHGGDHSNKGAVMARADRRPPRPQRRRHRRSSSCSSATT